MAKRGPTGVAEQPGNLVLQILRELRADVAGVKSELKSDLNSLRAELKSDLNSLRADFASDLLDVRKEIGGLRKETREQIVGVRRALTEYHSAVVGHGILISDLEERVRRLERPLDVPAPGAE
jgi:hypothetical protein